MDHNYIAIDELNFIKGLIHHLENLNPVESGVGVTVNLTDANGEPLGVVTYNSDADAYVYYPNGQN